MGERGEESVSLIDLPELFRMKLGRIPSYQTAVDILKEPRASKLTIIGLRIGCQTISTIGLFQVGKAGWTCLSSFG